MSGNWGKKTSNFGGRSASTGRFDMNPPKRQNLTPPRSEGASNLLLRVSEALRSANEKTGFVRTDAKK